MELPKSNWAREAPIIIGLMTVAGVVEAFSARYALATASTEFLGWMKAILMGACAVVMILAFRRVSMLADDPRDEVRKRVWQARLCAFGFMGVSITGAAGAFAYERAVREHEVYKTTPQYAEDQRMSKSFDFSREEREAARQRMAPPATADRQFGDFLFPLVLHGLAAFGAGALRAPTPLKHGEASRIAKAKAEAVENSKKPKTSKRSPGAPKNVAALRAVK